MRRLLLKRLSRWLPTFAFACCCSAVTGAEETTNSTDARAAFEAVQAHYASLQSLHQRCTWTSAPVPGEEPPSYAVGGGAFYQSSDLFFERPNRVRINNGLLELLSNGTTLWIVDPARNEVAIRPAPEEINNSVHLSGQGDIPVRLAIGLLLPGSQTKAPDPTALDIQFVSGVAIETRNGVTGQLISWKREGLEGPVSTAWVSSETGLIHQWTLVYRLRWPGNREDPNDDVVYHQQTDVECSLVTPNPEFTDGLFELGPETSLHEVERLSMFRWRDPSQQMPFSQRIAPTVALADSGIESFNSSRIDIEETFSNPMAGAHRTGDRIDINRDGINDLVFPTSQGEAMLVDGASAAVEILPFHGRAGGGNISKVIPVWLDDTRLWLVESNHHERSVDFYRVVFSLHGPDGTERWVYSPELAEGVSSQGASAVGDLDGDGTPEIAVGIRMHSSIPQAGDAFRIELLGSIITILDLKGERLSQIRFEGILVDLEMGGTDSDPFIIGVMGDQVVKLTFNKGEQE